MSNLFSYPNYVDKPFNYKYVRYKVQSTLVLYLESDIPCPKGVSIYIQLFLMHILVMKHQLLVKYKIVDCTQCRYPLATDFFRTT